MCWVLTRKMNDATAFVAAVQRRAGALLVAGCYFNSRRARTHALTAHVSFQRLRSTRDRDGWWPRELWHPHLLRFLSSVAGISLQWSTKGWRTADLPIQQPTKVELVVNLKTAKALGLVADVDPAERRRGDRMKRQFLALLGGAAIIPGIAGAQGNVRRIAALLQFKRTIPSRGSGSLLFGTNFRS